MASGHPQIVHLFHHSIIIVHSFKHKTKKSLKHYILFDEIIKFPIELMGVEAIENAIEVASTKRATNLAGRTLA